jgi:hypothetical protein
MNVAETTTVDRIVSIVRMLMHDLLSYNVVLGNFEFLSFRICRQSLSLKFDKRLVNKVQVYLLHYIRQREERKKDVRTKPKRTVRRTPSCYLFCTLFK